jgi:hypothetical protein
VHPLLRFGLFEADLDNCELRRQGLKISLQEQPFRVLAILLERPGQLITREELRERLWGTDTFVDFDQSLNKAALTVNPYDADELAAGIHTALTMPPEESSARMRRMRAVIREHNVYRWAGNLITELLGIRLVRPEPASVREPKLQTGVQQDLKYQVRAVSAGRNGGGF